MFGLEEEGLSGVRSVLRMQRDLERAVVPPSARTTLPTTIPLNDIQRIMELQSGAVGDLVHYNSEVQQAANHLEALATAQNILPPVVDPKVALINSPALTSLHESPIVTETRPDSELRSTITDEWEQDLYATPAVSPDLETISLLAQYFVSVYGDDVGVNVGANVAVFIFLQYPALPMDTTLSLIWTIVAAYIGTKAQE